MKSIGFLFIMCFQLSLSSAQDSLTNWVLMKEYPIEDDAVWHVDILQNIYTAHQRTITKYDSTGVRKFTQSIKSIGQIKDIRNINTMKVVLFSEDQQVLCLLDNTLTMSEELIDLSSYGIVNATMITTSAQPDKIWVLDQLNSRLLLLDLSGKMQFQEIRNLKGILNTPSITSMIEANSYLFLMTPGKYYVFDLYGTLLDEVVYYQDTASVHDMIPSGDRFYRIYNDAMISRDINGENEVVIKLPVSHVLNFKKINAYYYFRTRDKILKYAFKNIR